MFFILQNTVSSSNPLLQSRLASKFKSANPSPWLPSPLHLRPLGPNPGWLAGRRNLSGSGVHFDTAHFLQCSGKMRKKAQASGGKEGERVRKWISVPISSTAPVSHPGRVSNTMFYKLMFLEVGQVIRSLAEGDVPHLSALPKKG